MPGAAITKHCTTRRISDRIFLEHCTTRRISDRIFLENSNGICFSVEESCKYIL